MVPDDNPGNPWKHDPEVWPDKYARLVAKRELRRARETLARAKHPTARRDLIPRGQERRTATG